MDLKVILGIVSSVLRTGLHVSLRHRARSQMVIDNNEIQLKAGQKLQQQRSETIEQHEAWSGATGFDKSSTFKIA